MNSRFGLAAKERKKHKMTVEVKKDKTGEKEATRCVLCKEEFTFSDSGICPRCQQKKIHRKITREHYLETGIGWFLLIVACVILVSCIATCENHSTETSSKNYVDKNQVLDDSCIIVMAQHFVKENLMSPSSAKFPWLEVPHITRLGDSRYEVIGVVDAQNAFGAKLRKQYVCTLKYRHLNGLDMLEPANWTCEDLVFF